MQTEDESSAGTKWGTTWIVPNKIFDQWGFKTISNGTLECPHISIENSSKVLFANAMFWHLEESDVRLNALYMRGCVKNNSFRV